MAYNCGVGRNQGKSENFVFIYSSFKLKVNIQISKAIECQNQW